MTRQVYIAGKYEARSRLKPWAEAIRAAGYAVLSSWLDTPPTTDEDLLRAEAYRDASEVMHCDLLILDTLDESNTGGREVEWGIALDAARVPWLVGPVRNIFHLLAEQQFDTWEAALTALVKKRMGETS